MTGEGGGGETEVNSLKNMTTEREKKRIEGDVQRLFQQTP